MTLTLHALVPIKWNMPGSWHHGVVHLVSEALVDDLGDNKVVVWWPNRTRGKPWKGTREAHPGKLYMYQYSIAPTICCATLMI